MLRLRLLQFVLGGILLTTVAPSVQAAGLIVVSNSTVGVQEPGGLYVPANSGWIIRLFRSSNAVIDFQAGVPIGDDTFTGVEAVWSGTTPGYFNFAVTNPANYGINAGDNLYAVIVNGNTFTGATQCAIIGSFPQQVQDYSTLWHFDPGGVTSNNWISMISGPGTNSPIPFFSVTGVPFPCYIGQPVSPTVTVWDGTNIMTSYTGTVTFSSSFAANLPASYTFTTTDAGVHTFSNELTFLTYADWADLSVMDQNNTHIKGAQFGITVFHGSGTDYSRLLIHGINDPTTTGQWHTVSIAAVDSTLHIDTNYTGTIYFSSTDPLAVLPQGGLSYTFTVAEGGIHTFVNGLQFNTIGEQKFIVYDLPTSNSYGVSGAQSAITVQGTGSSTNVTHLILEHPDHVLVGTWNNIVLEARNQFEQNVPYYLGTVDFYCSDPVATYPSSYTFQATDNGHYFMPSAVAFNTLGTNQWIEIRDRDNTNLVGGTYNIDVSSGGSTGFGFLSATQPDLAIIGHPVPITLTIHDATGGVNTAYNGTVNFSFDPSLVMGPTSYTFLAVDMGTKTFTNDFTCLAAGDQTIMAQDPALAVLFANIYIKAIPGGSGPTESFELAFPDGPALPGNFEKVQIMALGPGNILNTNHAGAVTFSSSDPAANFAAPVVSSFTNGMADLSGQAQLFTVGRQTVRASLTSDTNIFGETEVYVLPSGSMYFVDGSSGTGSDAANGLTPTTAWQTLTFAQSQLVAGDTLIVRPGYFSEGLTPPLPGTPGMPIAIVADTYGRFWMDQGWTKLSPPVTPPLQLQGSSNIYVSGFEFSYSPSQIGALLDDAQDVDLENIMIPGQNAGINISHSSRVDIRDAQFSGAYQFGIAISSNSSDISISHAAFDYCNHGIGVDNSAPVSISDCEFQGGINDGVVIQDATVDIQDSMFGYMGAHGISGQGSASVVTIRNNAFLGNTASGSAGAIHVNSLSVGTLILNNTMAMNDHGIELVNSPGAIIRNNIIVQNYGIGIDADSASAVGLAETYNCVYGQATNWAPGLTPGTGDISVDPLFGSLLANGEDLHLQSVAGRVGKNGWTNDAITSPAIDAGDPTDTYNQEPSPNGSRIDMGVYGNTREASASAALPLVNFVVSSAYGTPIPPVGTNLLVSPSAVTASCPAFVSFGADTQYVNTGWTGTGNTPVSGATNNVLVLVTANSSLTWLWKTEVLLAATSVTANGSVVAGNGWYTQGTPNVPIQAIPAPGYHFVSWNGDVTSTNNPLTLTMNQAYAITASFAPDVGNISVTLNPSQVTATGAQWRVTSGADTNWHNTGAIVSNLQATAGPYTVTFKALSDWTAPADVTGIGIINGGTTSIVATYIQSHMILIPGGTYPMSVVSGSGGHTVTLSSFYMDRAPVTVAEYMTFATATAHAMPAAPSWGWNNSNLPMVNVTWNDASAYAAWVGKRLPTEAEYEYAMRSGFTNQLYPWGNSISSANANYNNTLSQPSVPGTYPANAYGLYDIAGNVWCWCGDWYQSTLTGPATNPNGPGTGQYKVIRGGGWASSSLRLQCAPRFSQTPTAAYVDVGFRCVADVGGVAGGTIAEPDRNANGVDDWWEAQYFGLSGFSANSDSDHDGLNDQDEYVAGTDPTSVISVLSISASTNGPVAPFHFQWSSVAGKIYDIQRADKLTTGFVDVSNGIPATPPMNTFTDCNGVRRGMYRVRVR